MSGSNVFFFFFLPWLVETDRFWISRFYFLIAVSITCGHGNNFSPNFNRRRYQASGSSKDPWIVVPKSKVTVLAEHAAFENEWLKCALVIAAPSFACFFFFAWSVYSVVLLLCAKRKPLLQKYFTPQMRGNETSNELRNCSLNCFFFFNLEQTRGVASVWHSGPVNPLTIRNFLEPVPALSGVAVGDVTDGHEKKNRWKGENNTEAGMRFEPRPSAWQSSILLQSHAGFCFLYWPFWLITNTKEKYIHNKTIGWKKISLES